MTERRKLTKRVVDALTGDAWDTELRGFGVRKHPTGRTVFVLVYRMPGSRRARRLTLGAYGPLTVDEARTAAKLALADVARGIDPAGAKTARRAVPTVVELGDAYLDDMRGRCSTSHIAESTRRWHSAIVPAIGSAKVSDVTTAQVAALHRRLRATPYEANRVLSLAGAFFTYAAQQGIRAKHTNPAHDVAPYPEHARERFLTPDEGARLSDALARAEREGLPPAPTRRRKPATGATAKHRPKNAGTPRPANPFAVAAIRFLLLTGWREREALTLRWTDVDTVRGVATLPRTKTGRSIRQLGAPALLLLSELPRLDDSPFVFPGRVATSPLVEINRVWYAVRHAAGLDDVRLHDLRHNFASVIASSGGSLLMIGKLLGHLDTTTTAKYAHLLDEPLRRAADEAAAHILAWGTPAQVSAPTLSLAR